LSDASVVLHQFRHSHFNEKARWGLDWKRVPHRRVTVLPGPHASRIRRLSGQTATPVLVLEGRTLAGSARILEALEERFPERALLPAHPELRRRALEIQAEFDAEVGPAVRTAVFSALIPEPGYLCRIFAADSPAPVRALYHATLPLVKGVIARANGVADPQAVARACERTRRALDFVAKQSEATGQLVGESFTLADLCCAALLAPLVSPAHPDMRKPEPMPESFAAFLAQWSTHPGTRWVLEQYARQRPPSCALAR
jgi:glutathione S-transferase